MPRRDHQAIPLRGRSTTSVQQGKLNVPESEDTLQNSTPNVIPLNSRNEMTQKKGAATARGVFRSTRLQCLGVIIDSTTTAGALVHQFQSQFTFPHQINPTNPDRITRASTRFVQPGVSTSIIIGNLGAPSLVEDRRIITYHWHEERWGLSVLIPAEIRA